MPAMTYKTTAPAYEVGARVREKKSGYEGIVTDRYASSGLPLWWGAERILHTHCYEVTWERGYVSWGLVDAELEPAVVEQEAAR